MNARDLGIESSLVRALVAAYRSLNWQLFGEALRTPVISLSDDVRTLGRWVPETREIRLSERFCFDAGWIEVEEVLKHEMAHQFVHEVLDVDEAPHGPVFRSVCEARGIDGRASGRPAAEGNNRALAKITKLLALASSSNQHEAERAMEKAQALMRDYNLTVVQSGVPQDYRYLQLGQPAVRVYEPERWLGAILSGHFFVDAIWVRAYDVHRAKTGSVLEICGTRENLEIAEYVHGFVSSTADRLWASHKADQGIKGNKDRRRFRTGVMRGFKEKLEAEERRARVEGLVWVGDADLMAYMRQRHPRTTALRRASATENEAYRAGRAAGRNIVLNKPVSSAGPSRGRRLGSGR